MDINLEVAEYKNCQIKLAMYENDRTAICIYQDEDLVAVATVNIPEEPLEENQVFIKDWSENEGMLQALIDNNVIKPTGSYVTTGYVFAPVCELLPEYEWKK